MYKLCAISFELNGLRFYRGINYKIEYNSCVDYFLIYDSFDRYTNIGPDKLQKYFI